MNTIKFIVVVSIVLLSTDLIYHQVEARCPNGYHRSADGDCVEAGAGESSNTTEETGKATAKATANLTQRAAVAEMLAEHAKVKQLTELINYCFDHASEGNPIQNLVNQGLISSEYDGQTCLSVRQQYDDIRNIQLARLNMTGASQEDKEAAQRGIDKADEFIKGLLTK